MRAVIVISAILYLLLVMGANAHVPVTASDNEKLEKATYIKDPTKSWAVYNRLEAGKVHYYRFHMEQGQRLFLSLFTPHATITPDVAIIGPGITSVGLVPDNIVIPEGNSIMVVHGKRPLQAFYEPFTPASQFELAQIDMDVNSSGTYYAVVYGPDPGPYGLAIGYREEFSLIEWIRVPLDVIVIHRWEGQSPAFIFAPMLAVLVIGLLYWQRKQAIPGSLSGRIEIFAGLLYVGSGATVLVQMGVILSRTAPTQSVIITLLLAMLPVAAGIIILRLAMNYQSRMEKKHRITMIVLGIAGLFIWAGLVIGPVLAIIAGLLPYRQMTGQLSDQSP